MSNCGMAKKSGRFIAIILIYDTPDGAVKAAIKLKAVSYKRITSDE